MRYPFTIDCGDHGYTIINERGLRDLAEQNTTLSSGFCRTGDPNVLLTVILRELNGTVIYG